MRAIDSIDTIRNLPIILFISTTLPNHFDVRDFIFWAFGTHYASRVDLLKEWNKLHQEYPFEQTEEWPSNITQMLAYWRLQKYLQKQK